MARAKAQTNTRTQAAPNKTPSKAPAKPPKARGDRGDGGETHQRATGDVLTTNQGVPVSDNQNSLRLGGRGPTLLEDFHLLEKIRSCRAESFPTPTPS